MQCEWVKKRKERVVILLESLRRDEWKGRGKKKEVSRGYPANFLKL